MKRGAQGSPQRAAKRRNQRTNQRSNQRELARQRLLALVDDLRRQAAEARTLADQLRATRQLAAAQHVLETL